MSQLNIRFIFKMLGLMFILEFLFVLVAIAVAFYYKGDDVYPLSQTAGIMLALGMLFYLIGFKANERYAGRREGMITVALTWAVLSFLGMLPFYLGGYITNPADAYFETMSGYTTTGATILSDIEALPKGILFWRSLLQWQGGVGMIVFTVALMPIFGGGASELFDAESASITHDRFRPRITQVAKRLWGVYVLLTGILVLLLWAGPMDLFDAVCHSFTTLATGGYSTKNASVAYWNSPYVEYMITIFMFIGAINFTLIYFFFKGNFKKLFHDEELRWFFFIAVGAISIATSWVYFNGFETDFETSFRKATFQVMTCLTTTGFATADYVPWGPFFWLLALMLMIICGCAGSTTGGLKTGRFVILVKSLLSEFKKQTHPHAVIPVRMDGHAVPVDIVRRVLVFSFVYVFMIAVCCFLLTLNGVGFEEAIGGCVSCASNSGPALGTIGPVSNYSSLPDFSKWVLSFLMMTGRLEIFTVLSLFLPGFWKQ